MLGDGLVGIDLDKCRNAETGEIEPGAAQIIRDLHSYTEIRIVHPYRQCVDARDKIPSDRGSVLRISNDGLKALQNSGLGGGQ